MFNNMHHAKTHLSELVDLACAGEEVIICKAGKPMVKLVKYEQEKGKRKPGVWRGKVQMSDDFDDSMEDLFNGDDL